MKKNIKVIKFNAVVAKDSKIEIEGIPIDLDCVVSYDEGEGEHIGYIQLLVHKDLSNKIFKLDGFLENYKIYKYLMLPSGIDEFLVLDANGKEFIKGLKSVFSEFEASLSPENKLLLEI